jgi:hypothetical protein
MQAASADRGDPTLSDKRSHVLGEAFTQAAGCSRNGSRVVTRSGLTRQQSVKHLFPRVPGHHEN